MKKILIAGLLVFVLSPISATAIDYRARQAIGSGAGILARVIVSKIRKRGEKKPAPPMKVEQVPENNGVSDIVGEAPYPGAKIAPGNCAGLTDCRRLPSPRLIFVNDRLAERGWDLVTAGQPDYAFDILVEGVSGRQDGGYSNIGFGGYGEASSEGGSRGQYQISFLVRRVSDGHILPGKAEVLISFTTYRQGYTTFWISGYSSQSYNYQNVSDPSGEAVRLGLERMLRQPNQETKQ